jgi:hemoglobin
MSIELSIHERLARRSEAGPAGADELFWRLARAFYRRVDRDPEFRAMFPASLEEPIRNQAEFLIQSFGGAAVYSARKGHPRLRMRHMPFRIDRAARDRWLGHMLAALDEIGVAEPERSEMRLYFERASEFLINTDDEASGHVMPTPG